MELSNSITQYSFEERQIYSIISKINFDIYKSGTKHKLHNLSF